MATAAETGERNHPLALRMGIIAFITQNLGVAALYGAYGVLIIPLEGKLGIDRTISTLGVPIAGIGIALLSPLVGGLTTRISLRLVMLAGSLMATLGFVLLAVTTSPALFLFAYAALIGPGFCLSGVLAPAILTTRWFTVGQGRALGIVNVPLMMALIPLIAVFVLESLGLDAVFLMLAGLMAVTFLCQLLVVDFPPKSTTGDAGRSDSALAEADVGAKRLLGSPTYWKLVIPISILFASIVMIGSHLAPMAIGWGMSSTQAASLLGIYAGAAIIGSPLFGWLADRIGGRLVLVIMAADLAILFGLLILQPSFPILLCLGALMGLHIASVPTAFALVVAEQFGRESFGRAYGILQLINLPLSVGSIPLAAWIFEATGSYTNALLLHVAVLVLAGLVVLTVRRPRIA